jgi:hypothetical protein
VVGVSWLAAARWAHSTAPALQLTLPALACVSQFVPVNPKPFLNDLTGKAVIVKLKWCVLRNRFLRSACVSHALRCCRVRRGMEYKGERSPVFNDRSNCAHLLVHLQGSWFRWTPT